MTAKQYLSSLKRLSIIIEQKKEELERLKAQSKSIQSFNYSKERIQRSPSTEASFVKIIDKVIDLSEKINSDIKDLIEQRNIIINQIQALSNEIFVTILYKRYVQNKELERIALEMNYSYDRIRHLHGCALCDFEKNYPFLKDSTQ